MSPRTLADVVQRLLHATANTRAGKPRDRYRVQPAKSLAVCAGCGDQAPLFVGFPKKMINYCTTCAEKLLTPRIL